MILDVIKKTLRRSARVPVDANVYVATLQDNLVPGVRLDQFKADLQQGSGHELSGKFCALHSSSALAVNTFAPFKDKPRDLILLGKRGWGPPVFEQQLPTGLKGTPPTLDVFFQCGEEVVAIEAKFLEYFSPKKAKFSPSYSKANLPWVEDVWWKAMEDATQAGRQHLDVAQLVKHYFGLCHSLSVVMPNPENLRRRRSCIFFGSQTTGRTLKFAKIIEERLRNFTHVFPPLKLPFEACPILNFGVPGRTSLP